MTVEAQPVRRIAAYAVCHRADGRVLLIRESAQSGTPGVWSLPGGAVQHGEHPSDTVRREVRAEIGVDPRLTEVVEVLADTRSMPHRGITLHTDRIIYRGGVDPSAIPRPVSPMVDQVAWFSRVDAESLQLRPFVAQALKLPLSTLDVPPDELPDVPGFDIQVGANGRRTVQRFAAYALAHDHSHRLLLTQVADGYPGAGRWHLPGGGTDFGEQPTAALLRELAEETGQAGRIRALLGVASHHDPEQVGPEGYPVDWHGVRPIYDVLVGDPTAVAVADVGGSTRGARWFAGGEVPALELTQVTREALDLWAASGAERGERQLDH